MNLPLHKLTSRVIQLPVGFVIIAHMQASEDRILNDLQYVGTVGC